MLNELIPLQTVIPWSWTVGSVAYTIRLVTPECTRGVIDPLYHSRHNGRDRQYECDRGIKVVNINLIIAGLENVNKSIGSSL